MSELSDSLGAPGREYEEKLPREQELYRLEKVVLALLHLLAEPETVTKGKAKRDGMRRGEGRGVQMLFFVPSFQPLTDD